MCVDKFIKDDDDSASEVAKYFNRANMDGDGHINQREFTKFVKDVGIKLSIYENLVLYKSIDKDRSGFITLDELESAIEGCEYYAIAIKNKKIGKKRTDSKRGENMRLSNNLDKGETYHKSMTKFMNTTRLNETVD